MAEDIPHDLIRLRRPPPNLLWSALHAARRQLGAVVSVAAAFLIGLALQRLDVGPSNIGFVFLTAVLVSAITSGLWPALVTVVLSVLVYNFFFLPPLYTLRIADSEHVVTFVLFGLVAVIAGKLADRVRANAVLMQERAAMMEQLYLFSRKLAEVFSLDDLLWATAYQMAHMLKARVVILLPDGGGLSVRAGYPPEDSLDAAGMAAAEWVWRNASAAGQGTAHEPAAKSLFVPMRTGRGTIGVVGIDSEADAFTPEQRRLFDALADQAALAVERMNLAGEIDAAKLAVETERLRAALLTSMSHDLRTPLASILGAATSLRSQRDLLDEDAREELLATIQDESERLNRFIANLLDMTRLESGAIRPKLEAADLSDVLGSALRRAGKVLARHKLSLDLAPDLPPVRVDPVLFEQVLFNLLDNAAKYAPSGTSITVRARADGERVRVDLCDEGEGVPAADLERIFDKFYRVHATDRKGAGTGLGLPICRGFMQAMGGAILAANRTDRRGAVFTILLPAVQTQEAVA